MNEMYLIADELLRVATSGKDAVGGPLRKKGTQNGLRLLRKYEHDYVATNHNRTDDWINIDFTEEGTDGREAMARYLDAFWSDIEKLEENGTYVLASKLALLVYLIGGEAGLYVQNFWEKAVNMSAFLDGYYWGDEFFYKLACDVIQDEIEHAINDQDSMLKVISFTPLLFLPSERLSMPRINAFRKYFEYLSLKEHADLRYLFCNVSTHTELRKMSEVDLNRTIGFVQDKLCKQYTGKLSLKYFLEGFGLRSCLLGTDCGVILERAETHAYSRKQAKVVLAKSIRGAVLEQERRSFDEHFNNQNRAFELTNDYFDMLKANHGRHLFARNKGVYSKEEQKRLSNARVGIIGLGCVGGIVAQTLTRIGIQELVLVDHDRFDPKNINRQPYATFETVGKLKVMVTESELKKISTMAKPKTISESLKAENSKKIIDQVDIVVQCVDDMKTRVVIHRVAKELGKPVVTMSGQPPYRGFVSTFFPDVDYEDVMGLKKETKNMREDRLCSNEANGFWEKCKLSRAQTALECAPAATKAVLREWLDGFVNGKEGWAVTFERTWIMGIIQAHEVVRFITGGDANVLAKAPKAILIDLTDIPNIVRIANPQEGDKWAIDGHWNYKYF